LAVAAETEGGGNAELANTTVLREANCLYCGNGCFDANTGHKYYCNTRGYRYYCQNTGRCHPSGADMELLAAETQGGGNAKKTASTKKETKKELANTTVLNEANCVYCRNGCFDARSGGRITCHSFPALPWYCSNDGLCHDSYDMELAVAAETEGGGNAELANTTVLNEANCLYCGNGCFDANTGHKYYCNSPGYRFYCQNTGRCHPSGADMELAVAAETEGGGNAELANTTVLREANCLYCGNGCFDANTGHKYYCNTRGYRYYCQNTGRCHPSGADMELAVAAETEGGSNWAMAGAGAVAAGASVMGVALLARRFFQSTPAAALEESLIA